MLKGIIKKQFNRQAKSFSSWSVTKNIEYMQAHFDFFRMNENDTMLDVACGTGEFSIFSAKRIKYVLGIDISDLFKANDLKIVNEFQIEIGLNFQEYLRHAYQSESSIRKIEKLLKFGLEDKGISKYFIIKDDELFFKRNVFLILGEKCDRTLSFGFE
jgi:SAM-dependent methyltransferase